MSPSLSFYLTFTDIDLPKKKIFLFPLFFRLKTRKWKKTRSENTEEFRINSHIFKATRKELNGEEISSRPTSPNFSSFNGVFATSEPKIEDGKNTSKTNSFSFIQWFHFVLLLSMSNLEEELHRKKSVFIA